MPGQGLFGLFERAANNHARRDNGMTAGPAPGDSVPAESALAVCHVNHRLLSRIMTYARMWACPRQHACRACARSDKRLAVLRSTADRFVTKLRCFQNEQTFHEALAHIDITVGRFGAGAYFDQHHLAERARQRLSQLRATV